MTPRTRNLVLLLLALPGLATPWVPFIQLGEAPDAMQWAFVDFLGLPATHYPQSETSETADATCEDAIPAEAESGCAASLVSRVWNPRWPVHAHHIWLTLPIFLPFLILYRQLRHLTQPTPSDGRSGRWTVALAFAWLAYFAAASIWVLPHQLLMEMFLTDPAHSLRSLIEQVLRMIGLFGSIAAGAWLLTRLWRRSATPVVPDRTECAFLITYIVTVLPELVTNGISVMDTGSEDRLLLGYALLGWTCAVYTVTLVVRFHEQRPLDAAATTPA